MERNDALLVAMTSGSLMVVSAIAAAVQTAWVQDVLGHSGQIPTLARLVTNLVEAVATVGALVGLGVHRAPRVRSQVVRVVLAALIASAARYATQEAFGMHGEDSWDSRLFQMGAGIPMALIAGCFALVGLAMQRRMRAETAQAARDSEARRGAMRALEDEEVRVRREVAEGLHGTAQQRLVLVVAGLDHLLTAVGGDPASVALVRDLREKVETVRTGDVRHASRMLYPHQVEVGMVAAVRSLLAEIPVSVATRLTVDPAVSALDEAGSSQFSRGERLLVARVVEEAISNALRHGRATRVEVGLALDGDDIVLTVQDDGQGLGQACDAALDGEGTGGLARLADRIRLVGGVLCLDETPGGGVVLRAGLPVATACRASATSTARATRSSRPGRSA
ncbi:MAG TPA: ATP-binding protein [Cellulomonas sp.]